MPGVIAYCGLPTSLSGWSLAFIGFFNIIGSLFAGWYISKRSKKIFLSSIYLSRAFIVLVFLISPKTEVNFLFKLIISYFKKELEKGLEEAIDSLVKMKVKEGAVLVSDIKDSQEIKKIVNCVNSDGFTPLHLAANEGHAPLIDILIKFPINIV